MSATVFASYSYHVGANTTGERVTNQRRTYQLAGNADEPSVEPVEGSDAGQLSRNLMLQFAAPDFAEEPGARVGLRTKCACERARHGARSSRQICTCEAFQCLFFFLIFGTPFCGSGI